MKNVFSIWMTYNCILFCVYNFNYRMVEIFPIIGEDKNHAINECSIDKDDIFYT